MKGYDIVSCVMNSILGPHCTEAFERTFFPIEAKNNNGLSLCLFQNRLLEKISQGISRDL